jgi:hypothetical protein
MTQISKYQLHWISRTGKSLCDFSIMISEDFGGIGIGEDIEIVVRVKSGD